MSKKFSPPLKSKETFPKVLCIGAPLLDRVFRVEESFLGNLRGKKGGMELIPLAEYEILLHKLPFPESISLGGSALNVAKVLSHLGTRSSFFGTLGNDERALFLEEKLRKENIILYGSRVDLPTGECLSFVTPDTKRTLRTFLGASESMSIESLEKPPLKEFKLIHFEGYLIDRENNFLEEAMKKGREHSALISLDLGSFEIAKRYKKNLLDLIEAYVDLLFCNAEEGEALIKKKKGLAAQELATFCPVAIVSDGPHGGYIACKKEKISYPIFPVTPLDTTGAGDFFAGGFLHAYLQGYPLLTCAKIGARVAAEVITVYGTDLSLITWNILKTYS